MKQFVLLVMLGMAMCSCGKKDDPAPITVNTPVTTQNPTYQGCRAWVIKEECTCHHKCTILMNCQDPPTQILMDREELTEVKAS